jgi:hypothetical protein
MENLDLIVLTGIVAVLFAAFAFTLLKATSRSKQK